MTAPNAKKNFSQMTRVAIECVERLRLDLRDKVVITEAATDAYACTAALAAAAGAQVVALAKGTAWGTAKAAQRDVKALAKAMKTPGSIEFISRLTPSLLGRADVITNSGHLRPLNAAVIKSLAPHAVIPTMYEEVELRRSDIDLEVCRKRGIRVGGTNEQHPSTRVLDYLGPAVAKSLFLAGWELTGQSCLVITDNLLGDHCAETLSGLGARVTKVTPAALPLGSRWDVVIMATLPKLSGGKKLSLKGIEGGTVCQVWGDAVRSSSKSPWIPQAEPASGAMGVPLSVLGSTPIIKLQAAGLKCAEVMLNGGSGEFADIVQWIVGSKNEE